MVYITVKAPERFHQMSLEEFIYQQSTTPTYVGNETNTVTYAREELSDHFLRGFDCNRLISLLEQFNNNTDYLRMVPRNRLYTTYYIPKSSGGLRRIDAPSPELKEEIRAFNSMIINEFYNHSMFSNIQPAYYHTSAFAYIKGRRPYDCVKRHKDNESNWYAHLDLSNFFGSTTIDYAMKMLEMIFPFCEICKSEHGKEELRKAIDLGFLNGILTQGSPLSPLLTNIIMVPIDYILANTLRKFDGASSKKQRYVYTRYCDDIVITSRYGFDIQKMQKYVGGVLRSFGGNYVINNEKTHYGSRAGKNFVLGMMVNKDNDITIGHKNKKRFQAMLDSFVRDTLNGKHWDRNDIQVMDGLRSYYVSIEGETIDELVKYIGGKHGVNIREMIRKELNR